MDPDGPLRIEVVEQAGDWGGLDVSGRVESIGPAISGRLSSATGLVVLVLADDDTVRDLNRRFRNQDKATNVLSFPSDDTAAADAYLGDVVLAIDTLRREADGEGTPVDHHFAHLAVHGILHLMGYDHQSDDEADRMERLETSILSGLGIADPYAVPAMAGSETT